MDKHTLVPLRRIWESLGEFTQVPDASEVDGVHVLAKVVGPAFFPNEVSGNNVEYPEKVWSDVLNDPKVIKALADKTMFGTIGHDVVMDDNAMRQGLASHITTKMWVDEETGVGMAEYLILNTPVGQVLNTVLRAGAKLRVSTKANGAFGPTKPNGVKPLIAYFFERIDFVLTPGFTQALPAVMESLNEEEQEVLNKIIASASENEPDQQEAKPMDDKAITLLEGQVDDLKQQVAQKSDELASTQGQLSECQTELAGYQALGTADEISDAMDQAADTIENLNEALNVSSQLTAQDLIERQAVNESLAKYKALGSVEELTQLVEVSESIAKLGSLQELTELVEVSEARAKEELNARLQKLAEKAKVPLDAVVAVYESKQDVSAVAQLFAINEDDNSEEEEQKEEEKKEEEEQKKQEEEEKKEEEDASESLKPSRAARLTSGMIRGTNLVTKAKIENVSESAAKKEPASRASKLMHHTK